MFELAIRVILGAVLMGLSGVTGKPEFDLAVKVAAFGAVMGIVVVQIERKGLRNPGIAGFIAVASAALAAKRRVGKAPVESSGRYGVRLIVHFGPAWHLVQPASTKIARPSVIAPAEADFPFGLRIF